MIVKIPYLSTENLINTDTISWIRKLNTDNIRIIFTATDSAHDVEFASTEDRDKSFSVLSDMIIEMQEKSEQVLHPIKEHRNMLKGLFEDLRIYLKENRDMVYTIGLVLLVDHFVFEGAFRDRLKRLVEGFLTKAEVRAGVVDTVATRVE